MCISCHCHSRCSLFHIAFGASCLQVCGVEAIRQHCGRYKHFGFTGQTAGIAIGHLVFPLVLRGMLLVSVSDFTDLAQSEYSSIPLVHPLAW